MSEATAQDSGPGLSTTRLPNFIIAGAMKSGTRSVHYILNQHKRVFIPDHEIHFFDIDDIEQHPDFFVEAKNEWSFYNYEEKFDEYLSWYEAFFRDAKEGQFIGEDSTTYMASEKAAYRIAKLLPDVKLIFMLRDPVMRAYSHYWHLVNTGRAFYSFEKTIQYMSENIIKRSCYKEQIDRYKNFFPDKNMKFIIFESFIGNTQVTIDEICEFLGLQGSIDVDKIDRHRNRTPGFRSVKAQRIYNLVFRNLATRAYLQHLPDMPYQDLSYRKQPKLFRIFNGLFQNYNRTSTKVYPAMKPTTQRFLQKLFAKENKGLSHLIDSDVQRYWTYFEDRH